MDYIKLDDGNYMIPIEQDILKYNCFVNVPDFIVKYIDLHNTSSIHVTNLYTSEYIDYGEENTMLENISVVEFTDMMIAMLNYTNGECYTGRPNIEVYKPEGEKLSQELEYCKNVGKTFVIENDNSIRFIDIKLVDINILSKYNHVYHYMNNIIVEIPTDILFNVERISLLYILYGLPDGLYNIEDDDNDEILNENIELFRKESAFVQEEFEVSLGKTYKYFNQDSDLSEVLGFLVLFELMAKYNEFGSLSCGGDIHEDIMVIDGVITVDSLSTSLYCDDIIFSEYRVSFLYNFNGTRTTYLKECRDIYNKDETELIINI